MPRPSEADFGIEIDFTPGSDAPSRVFRAMSALIETFQEVDKELLGAVATIEPVLLLEDIEAGSIRTWLRTQLEGLDDEVLKTGEWKKILGAYLVKAKYIVIDFLNKRSTVVSKAEIEELQGKLLVLAQNTDVLGIPTYRPIPLEKVADSVFRISQAIQPLKKPDSAKYLSGQGDVDFNLDFQIAPENLESLITREIITNTPTLILKVKKPDFLGESMWEFRFEDRPFEAKLADTEWLKKFKEREVVLQPGDAIKAEVETKVHYSYEGEAIHTANTILRVIEIIRVPGTTQGGLFVG